MKLLPGLRYLQSLIFRIVLHVFARSNVAWGVYKLVCMYLCTLIFCLSHTCIYADTIQYPIPNDIH